MAKQYLFFKLCSEPVNYVPVDRLFKRELATHFKSLHKIETVFELNRFAEIRQLIDKDVKLQAHITHALPDGQNHGYLVIVDALPPAEKMVTCLAFCDEFILFQRSHEPKDTYIRYLAGINLVKQMQIYNWRIFIIPTLSAFKYSLSAAISDSPNMDKTDKILSAPEKIFRRGFDNHSDPMHESHNTLDPLHLPGSRLFAALTNILTHDCTHFSDLSTQSAHLLQHAGQCGRPITGYTRTYLQTIENRLRTRFSGIEIPVLQAAVPKFTNLLGQLLDEPKYRQSHLFYSDIDHAFKIFESKVLLKNGDVKSYKRHLKIFRNIIAARFLIVHKYITHDESINLFLSFNLLQTILMTLRSRTVLPFSAQMEKNADKLISEMYLCRKTNDLFSVKPVLGNILQSHHVRRHGPGRQSFFVRLPEDNLIHTPGAKNNLQIAMNLFQAESKNNKNPLPPGKDAERHAAKLKSNRYLRDKLEFFRTFLSREDYLSLTAQCLRIFDTLENLLKILRPGDRLGMLSPVKFHYVDDTPHEFAFPEIIREQLDLQENVNFQTEFRMRTDTGDPYRKQDISIISIGD